MTVAVFVPFRREPSCGVDHQEFAITRQSARIIRRAVLGRGVKSLFSEDLIY